MSKININGSNFTLEGSGYLATVVGTSGNDVITVEPPGFPNNFTFDANGFDANDEYNASIDAGAGNDKVKIKRKTKKTLA